LCACVRQARLPDDVQGHVGVVELAVDAVVVQGDDVVQLGHGHVHVRVVPRVQGDAAHAHPVGEEQVGLGGVVAGVPVALQQHAGGAGAGRAVGPRQTQVGAAAVPLAALVETWGRGAGGETERERDEEKKR